MANLRGEALHQLTTELAGTYGTVVVERLNVAGMVRNRHLARAIADSGMGQVRRLLGYKTVWAGGRLIEADTFFPSSKTCSRCGMVKAKLSLHERVFGCQVCGLELDRDENAARNLAALIDEAGRREWLGDREKRLCEGLSARRRRRQVRQPRHATARREAAGSQQPIRV